jgi:hypothetical protein
MAVVAQGEADCLARLIAFVMNMVKPASRQAAAVRAGGRRQAIARKLSPCLGREFADYIIIFASVTHN